MYRDAILDDQIFIHRTLESGKLFFVVRGNVDCETNYSFDGFKMRIYGPTKTLRVEATNADQSGTEPIYIAEVHDERVFHGEIDLPEKSLEGINRAYGLLQLWADILCLNLLGRIVKIDIQTPQFIIGVRMGALGERDIQRGNYLTSQFFSLSNKERESMGKALWWFRNGCAAEARSVFEAYTAYWNSLEILCKVNANQIKNGTDLQKQIADYLGGRIPSPSDIQHLYNNVVNYSIRRQIEDGLKPLLDQDQVKQCIHQCFEITPKEIRLYQIRNDINHGNVQENDGRVHLRVGLRKMLLHEIVKHILFNKLGLPLGPRPNFDEIADHINEPFIDKSNPSL